MKKPIVIMLLSLLVIPSSQFCVETIVLKDGTDFERRLADNDVFLKKCDYFEFLPEKNRVFFLDSTYCQVFVVEFSTGKLLRTISNKGQGPAEIQSPMGLIVKNNLIFILDRGFNGVKIFRPNGTMVNEFRFKSTLLGRRNIDVNDKNEIFVGKADYNDKTMVSVYDIQGNKIRSLIRFNGEDKRDKDRYKISRYQYLIKLDKKGNILVLYYMLRKLEKYNAVGKFIWEADVKNKILDKFPRDEYIKRKGKAVYRRWYVFNLDVTKTNDIVVGHVGGGCLFSEEGKLKKMITVMKMSRNLQKILAVNLDRFKIRGNILMNVLLFGKSIYYYKFKEVIP
jgi:hypothetical protein